MSQPANDKQVGCGGKCSQCNMKDAVEPGAYCGWRLTMTSLVIFIIPIGLAILGAISLPTFWASEHATFAGAGAGLAAGFVVSAIISIVIRKSGNRKDECDKN